MSKSVPVSDVLVAVANSLLDCQIELDQRARASLVRWEEDGILPTCFAFSSLRLSVPVGTSFLPDADGHRIRLSLDLSSTRARMTLTIGRRPMNMEHP
jgi:hypothetical protein